MDPAALLARHGLPAAGIDPVKGGLVNRVWRTRLHVVRVSARTDHAREARLAAAARAAGVRTPLALAHGDGYSIWERWPGEPPRAVDAVPHASWLALLEDLERVHAHPLEPLPSAPLAPWRGRLQLIDRTQHASGWTREERAALERLLSPVRPTLRPTFVHGDAFAGNVLVDDSGGYVGLIDWGCARWSSLDEECARLETPALEIALTRWADAIDPASLWARRLDLLLEVASFRHAPIGSVRSALQAASGRR